MYEHTVLYTTNSEAAARLFCFRMRMMVGMGSEFRVVVLLEVGMSY